MGRLAFALVVAAAIGGQAGYLGASRAQMGERRFFTVLAVEPRGGVNAAQEAFPTEALPAGGGYVVRPLLRRELNRMSPEFVVRSTSPDHPLSFRRGRRC